MYKYFVSFNCLHGTKEGFGHTEITLNVKITGIEVIREVAKIIEGHFDYPEGSVAVLNFQPFYKEENDVRT